MAALATFGSIWQHLQHWKHWGSILVAEPLLEPRPATRASGQSTTIHLDTAHPRKDVTEAAAEVKEAPTEVKKEGPDGLK